MYHQIQRSRDEIEMDLIQVGSEPVGVRCPYCQEDVMSRVEYKVTMCTHVIALILGILLWWMGGCLIPYFLKRWKDVEHYCSNCGKFLGVHWRCAKRRKHIFRV
ncbi:unnamed protein product [Diatraea saccharalis]|uniref:LITAF domain-containing protein n=1 Tax=Diatraea saccharalis TaxID=40085 RepID=A0A9N9W856_9NEOP|nr:unnamed protein product [Diatraea saccharalis]